MDWGWLFTSFDGRANRAKFWAGNAVILVVWIVVVGLLAGLGDSASFWVLYPFAVAGYVVASLAVNIKRWHDRDKSGWWVLMSLVPIIGPIWVVIETGFLRGTDGPNQYGDNPLTS